MKLCTALDELATTHEELGAVERARECYEEALSVARDNGPDDRVQVFESTLDELR